jgi:hypothetical protein
MYALSAIVRNNPDAQAACEHVRCFEALRLSLDATAPALARKACVLLSDLIHESLAAAAAQASGRVHTLAKPTTTPPAVSALRHTPQLQSARLLSGS